MDRIEQKRLLREQRAGFELLRRKQIEMMRVATFADRLDAFTRIMGFVEHLDPPVSREDDELLAERWAIIRGRYAAKT